MSKVQVSLMTDQLLIAQIHLWKHFAGQPDLLRALIPSAIALVISNQISLHLYRVVFVRLSVTLKTVHLQLEFSHPFA